ncbi:MAG TPA: MFS transporter [Anaerolineales bacterium]
MTEAVDRGTERWALAATILASSMAFVDGSALNVALPALQASLHASGAQLLWIVNGYLLMLASLILVGGTLGDRLGRKKVFQAGIGLFMLASLGSGLSPTVEWIIPARIVQGIGGSLMIPGSLALISALLPPDRRGRAIGTWSAATTLVNVAGPVLGGFLADHGLWRGVFLINLPLGVIALAVLAWKVPESRDESASGPLDFLGAALVTAGLAGVSYGFLSAPDLGFSDPRVFAPLALGIVALAAFVLVEARKAHPMMPLGLFKSSDFSGANLLTLFLYGALSAVSFFVSLDLVQVQGYSKTEAGLSFLPFAILLTVMSRWAGGLVDRRGPRLPLTVGPTLVGCGFFWLAFTGVTSGPGAYWTTFFPGMFLFGVGMGLTVAPLTATVMGSVASHLAGTASGINNAVSRIAGVLAIATLGAAALIMFAGQMEGRAASIDLSAQARQELHVQARNLSGAVVPASVGQGQTAAVESAIKDSFAQTFKVVVLACAGLAWASALATLVLIGRRKK